MPATARGRTSWLGRHQQRVLYALAAVSLIVTLAAGAVGGVLLRHAANVERQALRTQSLAGAVSELQSFSLRLEAQGPTTRLAAERAGELADANAALRAVTRHDRAEGDRLRGAYLAYVEGSTDAFRSRTPVAQQGSVDRELSRFNSLVNVETTRLAHATQVANPRTRFVLVITVVSALLLVVLLIWQFELQRKAGRIDRDNAARSEELSSLREEFVAAVSHELRTPLTSIIGYLDLVVDGEMENLTTEQQSYLGVVQRNADRLHELVGDLLLVAEAEGGALALDINDVDLDALATRCVESARPAADAEQIGLTVEFGATRLIRGDAVRLEQMMDNLVSNALKFTPSGGRVAVRTATEDGHALFEVSDDGPGISAADQAQLFDRFFRTRDAIDQAIRGTGLGLAITKAIVDAHHGSITVESAVGRYSIFRVRLPEAYEPAAV